MHAPRWRGADPEAVSELEWGATLAATLNNLEHAKSSASSANLEAELPDLTAEELRPSNHALHSPIRSSSDVDVLPL